jgi:hypothetical protein
MLYNQTPTEAFSSEKRRLVFALPPFQKLKLQAKGAGRQPCGG